MRLRSAALAYKHQLAAVQTLCDTNFEGELGDEEQKSPTGTCSTSVQKLCKQLTLCRKPRNPSMTRFAGMAKLADAADLKSAGPKRPVGVRFPLPAPANPWRISL